MNKLMTALKKEKGTTLIEVILSVALLGIIVVPLMGAVMSAVNTNVAAKDRIEAIALSEKVMEEIKAQKVFSPETLDTEVQYTIPGSGDLVPYYKIEEVKGVNISSYNNEIPENFDFELEIDQDNDKVILKTSEYDNFIGETFNFQIKNVGGIYQYFFDKSAATIDMKDFVPFDNNIRLKVTYRNTHEASRQLKIFTSVDSNLADKFNVYVINDDISDSGVNFINKSSVDFGVYYYDSQFAAVSEPLNKLFKITVKIKKNTDVIYEQISNVKK